MGFANKKINQFIGVDIGGSHIAVAVIEANKIVQGSYIQTKVDSSKAADLIIDTWVSTINDAVKLANITANCVAVAMPGPFDYENGISLIKGMNKYEALYGLNIKQLFSERLNVQTSHIHFFNDAKAFILGEAVTKIVYNKIIGITIGTGLGSAKCTNFIAEDVNRGSSPFLDGIVEDYLSTRWFVKRYFELTGQVAEDVKSLCNLVSETAIVQRIFDEFADNLIEFLDDFIAFESPDAVIIGGNIAKASDRFLPKVQSHLLKKYPNVAIQRTNLWDTAAIIGAGSAANNINILASSFNNLT